VGASRHYGGGMSAARNWLPSDVARCQGVQSDGLWRDGCEDCLRRTAPPIDPERVWMMAPPVIVVFECEARIEPRETTNRQPAADTR
jgi:hypothetical protein